MTSSRTRGTSKFSRFWSGLPSEARAAGVLFLLLSGVAGTLGLADDEAYYWALAQTPRLGFAYHPPGVVWSIALAQVLFAWLPDAADIWVARVPALIFSSLTLWLGMRWVRRTFGERSRPGETALVLISLPGLYALGWMIVPDWGLFFFEALVFVAVWEICFATHVDARLKRAWIGLVTGTIGVLLFKLSAILVLGSAGLALLIWSPPRLRVRALVLLVSSACIGMVPFLIWNAANDWGVLTYQLTERHGGWAGRESWLRFARFWGAQALGCGLPMLAWGFWFIRGLGRGQLRRTVQYATVWMAPPALVYGLQPLWGEFKPHWGFLIWWPALWVWAGYKGDALWQQMRRIQVLQSAVVMALVVCVLYTPLISYLGKKWTGQVISPLTDISNDLRGWELLAPEFKARGWIGLPVVASRYQIAGQAAFALRGMNPVEQLPRTLRESSDWRSIGVSTSSGSEWPPLSKRVIYVSDARYAEAPRYPGTLCREVTHLEQRRGGFGLEFAGKRITLWDCQVKELFR